MNLTQFIKKFTFAIISEKGVDLITQKHVNGQVCKEQMILLKKLNEVPPK